MAQVRYVDIPMRKDAGGRVVFSGYRLARDICEFGRHSMKSAVRSPTLMQLRHGYETSEELRRNILVSRKGYGEFVRAAIGPCKRPRGVIVPRRYIRVAYVVPDSFERDSRHGWRAEGKSKIITLPPSGWQGADAGVLYDEDGWPVRTYSDRREAISSILNAGLAADEREAQNLASYFYRRERYDEFAAAGRGFWRSGCGPWALHAHWLLTSRSSILGFRPVEDSVAGMKEMGLRGSEI